MQCSSQGKQAVLDRKKLLDAAGVANQEGALRASAGQAFYNASPFTLASLQHSGGRLRDDFNAYLDGYSENVQEILGNFGFRTQVQKLATANLLGHGRRSGAGEAL